MSDQNFVEIEACVFDAYGTLFDVHSAAARLRDDLGEKADALSEMWYGILLEMSVYTVSRKKRQWWLLSLRSRGNQIETTKLVRERSGSCKDQGSIACSGVQRDIFEILGLQRYGKECKINVERYCGELQGQGLEFRTWYSSAKRENISTLTHEYKNNSSRSNTGTTRLR